MSVCIFIASDMPLAEFAPPQDHPIRIDIENGTIDDGSADDNYHLLAFDSVGNYTEKCHGVSLEWRYTDGRARKIISYIKTALQKADEAELWKVWLTEYYEFEDRPFIHRKTVSVNELTAEDIRDIEEAVIWNTPDKMYPQRPSFYCLRITG